MSGDSKIIEIQKMPDSIGNQPNVFFKKDWFDNVIYQQGYNVIIEKSNRCPCKSKGTDNLSSCRNCGGSGFFFINKIQTKAILHSINLQHKFEDWSETNQGNVNVSVRDIDKLAFMDRITLLHGESVHTQNCYPSLYKTSLFSFLNYEAISVQECFMFNGDTNPLKLLVEGSDFTIAKDKILLDKKYQKLENVTLSVRYIHHPQFYVIDILRDVMWANIKDLSSGKIKKSPMPISGLARRAHYIIDRNNFNSDYIIDNSYEKICGHKEDTCNTNATI